MYQTLTIFKSSDYTFTGAVTLNGAALNLTGAGLWMTAKYNFSDADNVAVFQLKSAALGGSDITITNAAGGLISITIPDTATSTLPLAITNLVYDIKLIETGGRLATLAYGQLIVMPPVTRAIA